MPRPKKDGSGPPKKRSRFGCWPCKQRKIKCGEEKPTCSNCVRAGETCDYSIRLNWDASKSRSKSDEWMQGIKSMPNTPSTIIFPSPDIFSGKNTPVPSPITDSPKRPAHSRSHSSNSTSQDPKLMAQSTLSFDHRPQLLGPSWTASSGSGASGFTHPGYTNQASSIDGSTNDRNKRARLGPGELSPIPNNFNTIMGQRSPIMMTSPPLGYPMNSEVPLFDRSYDTLGEGLSRSSTETERDKQGRIEFKAIACRSYGYDSGLIDQDEKNDDSTVLVMSPSIDQPDVTYDAVTIDFDNYYAKPVKVAIPISLHPLPDTLKHNQMNLLYFHHFLNHTARILTPHDCPDNPFRTALPESKCFIILFERYR
jgi:hypothetical protein